MEVLLVRRSSKRLLRLRFGLDRSLLQLLLLVPFSSPFTSSSSTSSTSSPITLSALLLVLLLLLELRVLIVLPFNRAELICLLLVCLVS